MGALLQDFRYASRILFKKPGFTAVAALTLALGIGVNTVIFSAFNTIMLRPPAYTDPDRIVMVWSSIPQLGIKKYGVPYANLTDWQQRNRVFDRLTLFQAASNTTFNLTGLSGPERIQGTRATADFFAVLNVAPLRGRTIVTEDQQPGSDH